MSTHNLCFGAKIRKIGIRLRTPFYYIKVGFKGIYITRTSFPDVYIWLRVTDEDSVPEIAQHAPHSYF